MRNSRSPRGPQPAGFRFSIAFREDLYRDGRRVESRLSHGHAEASAHGIVAASGRDAELVAACEEDAAFAAPPDSRGLQVRVVASARRIGPHVRRETIVTMSDGKCSVVSRDPSILERLAAVRVSESRTDLPILWTNGSASVLLHEAVGHAAEEGATAVPWPGWLEVTDEPPFPVDDVGSVTVPRNLLTSPPSAWRRESFRNIPIRRMSNVVVRQTGAPFDLPARFIEVHALAGGSYDPLTDTVVVDVAVSTAGSFRIRRKRSDIAASLAGARGEPLAYPGVICSREGQELAVGSSAPDVITT